MKATAHLRRSESSAHLLKDVGRGHETEADGLHDGVRVPPAPPVVPQPRLHCFVQLDFWEATQSVAVQVRLDQTNRRFVVTFKHFPPNLSPANFHKHYRDHKRSIHSN